jgi:hypothetical protein
MEVWTPIKDGWHEDKSQHQQRTFHVAGDKLRVDERLPLVLGPSVRVCELVDQPDAPAGAGVLTDEVRVTIVAALNALRGTRLVDLWYLNVDQDIRGEPIDAVLAWLAEQGG